MAKKIIVFSGKKQVGKDSSCDFIIEELKKRRPEIKTIKTAFADSLKQLCIDYLGLTTTQCYGTDNDKNSLTRWLWDDIAPEVMDEIYQELDIDVKKSGPMTAREVLQVFGTNIMRRYFCPDVWSRIAFNQINNMPEDIVMVSDARFPNEIKSSIQNSALIIRILRPNNPIVDNHFSEKALDDMPNSVYDYVVKADELTHLLGQINQIMMKENIY